MFIDVYQRTYLDQSVNVEHEGLLTEVYPNMHTIVPLHPDRRVEGYTLRDRKILERDAFNRQLDPRLRRKGHTNLYSILREKPTSRRKIDCTTDSIIHTICRTVRSTLALVLADKGFAVVSVVRP